MSMFERLKTSVKEFLTRPTILQVRIKFNKLFIHHLFDFFILIERAFI